MDVNKEQSYRWKLFSNVNLKTAKPQSFSWHTQYVEYHKLTQLLNSNKTMKLKHCHSSAVKAILKYMHIYK